MWAKTQELECSRGGDHYLRFFDHRKILSRSRRMFVIVFLSPTFFLLPTMVWQKRKDNVLKNCNHINSVALRLPLLGVFCAKSQIPNQKIKAHCSTYFPLENFREEKMIRHFRNCSEFWQKKYKSSLHCWWCCYWQINWASQYLIFILAVVVSFFQM